MASGRCGFVPMHCPGYMYILTLKHIQVGGKEEVSLHPLVLPTVLEYTCTVHVHVHVYHACIYMLYIHVYDKEGKLKIYTQSSQLFSPQQCFNILYMYIHVQMYRKAS